MTVVSDTSPITNLAAIGQLNLLRNLYGNITIPEAVYAELTDLDIPVAGTTEVQTLAWIQTRPVANRNLVARLEQELDAGESEAIALAIEQKPCFSFFLWI